MQSLMTIGSEMKKSEYFENLMTTTPQEQARQRQQQQQQQQRDSLAVSVFNQRPQGRGFETRWLRAVA